jgi:hypothetical protein
MRVIDASSLLHAWDEYPIENFPKLWEWLETEIIEKKIVLSRVAIEEVDHISPDCRAWLGNINNFAAIEIDNAIATHAIAINTALGIQNDQYGTGVDYNDVIIIATAKSLSYELISNESRQPALPPNRKRYKIPAVCSLPDISVACINFRELIRASNQVF